MCKSERYRGVSPTSLSNTTQSSSPKSSNSSRTWNDSKNLKSPPSTVTGSTISGSIPRVKVLPVLPSTHAHFRKDPGPSSSSHMQHRRHHRHSHSGSSSTDTGSSREVESRGHHHRGYRTSEEVRDESEMVISAVEKPKHHHHHHHHRHKHRPRESESSSKSRY